ncbi:hypothetical protein ACIRG4_21165 [Streptomyces sp. NPDC102395]|uniref:hypothetical protein n=1 Tax=Streptomyces sp. NPDC102395 TaxID=3366168 RepID=UPI00382BD703
MVRRVTTPRKPLRNHGPKLRPLESKRWWIIATVILLPALFLLIQFGYAPFSEVQNQHAVEKAHDDELARNPALLAKTERIWDSSMDGWTWVFPGVVSRKALASTEAILFGRTSVPAGDSEVARNAARRVGGYRTSSHCGTGANNIPVCTPVGRYKVTLTGNRRQKVQIVGIKASVVSQRKPPLGTLLIGPTEGGGPIDAVFIDLDSADKEAVAIDEANNPTDRPFVDVESRWTEEGEPLVFEVMAGTKHQSEYKWKLLVEISYGGKRETIQVPANEGDTFQTVGWKADWPYGARYKADQATHRFVVVDPSSKGHP